MQAFEETVAALGNPVSCVALDDWNGRTLLVGRWRHGSARILRSPTDTFRLALSLGFEQRLHHAQDGASASATCRPGDLSLLPPATSSETTVDGEADVVQIFIDAGALDARTREPPTIVPRLRIASEDLRACVLSLFLTARTKEPLRTHGSTVMLRETLHRLIAAQARADQAPHRGGLRPDVLRRLDDMIDARLDATYQTPPALDELSRAACLSPNHFIRAFRQATGTTPHQYVMARRRQRAMALLRQPHLPIAEIGDMLGFSSAAHFIAAFRRRFGATPGDYRRAVLDPEMASRGSSTYAIGAIETSNAGR